MDYEKKYKEGVEWLRDWIYLATTGEMREQMEKHFPELKESEDERIRKSLSAYFAKFKPNDMWDADFSFGDIVAWLEKQGDANKEYWRGYREGKQEILDKYAELEKQGEQKLQGKSALEAAKEEKVDNQNCVKPVNNVEPKFKVGDWVVSPNGVYWHIDAIQNGRYEVTADTGQCGNWPLDTNIYRLCTIQDAKNGDVLYDGDNACLFRKKIEDDDAIWVDTYCGTNSDGMFIVNDEDECWCFACDCVPATKEQREQLEKAMSNAGYEFDFDKKELRKIGHKPAWSKEDESRITTICTYLQDYARLSGSESRTIRINEYCDWLKSLNPQSRWKPSEQEKAALRTAIQLMTKERSFPLLGAHLQNILDAFEGESRVDWKPSKGQMEALKEACNEHYNPKGELYSLYEQLKKLTE